MYTMLLHLHNTNRWLLILAGLVALVGIVLWLRTNHQTNWTRIALRAWVVLFDLQLLMGLALFAVSPILRAGFQDPFGHEPFRYFAMEHALPMMLALVLVHWGSYRLRRSEEPCFCHAWPLFLAYVIMLATIPWDRPLFPGMG